VTSDRSPLGAPVQIAYACTGVADAARAFSERTGAGPFFVIEHIALASSRVWGVDAPFDHSSAYGQWGALMVELLEEHTVLPDRPLVEPGRVHHLAFMVDSLVDAAAWCDRHGWPEALRAATESGQEFAFHDARGELGHLVELYEPSGRLTSFYEMVASAAQGWTGDTPVRLLG
jgi:catechol 2,3-dioxygenase-like lactoylglutathione lyase family enzyme